MTPNRRLPLEASLMASALLVAGCSTPSPQAQSAALIARAEAALGSAGLKTLTVSGRGSGASVGQAWAPGAAWPGQNLRALSRSMNFETKSFREEFIRSRSEALGGGALPPMGGGEARGVVLAREAYAWDVAGVATPPAPAAWPARVHDLWLGTPQAAIKAAAGAGARAGVRRDFLRRWDTLSFELPGSFSATLVLEDTGLISSIESTLPHAVLGRMPVLTRFLDYRPQAGLMLPARIVQDQGGFAALDLQLTEAATNEAVEITIPDNVRTATESVAVEKLAAGVWLLGGGTHHSVAIELATQMALVEAPLHEGRARAVLDAANKLVAGKKVRSVINTHHHFDHAGGLRAALADGAEVYTSTVARPYFEAVLAQATVPGGARPAFTAVGARTVLDDATQPLEIHELQDSPHARGLLVVWLPREQLLIEADAYTPAAPDAPPPAVADANALNLVQNLERLGIRPRLVVPLHGRVVPVADLYLQAGRKPSP